jgi:hypothetical protein
MVINTVMDVYDTHTRFAFVESQGDVPEGLELSPTWIPEGFELVKEEWISVCSYQYFENQEGNTVIVEKYFPTTLDVDTENAEVTSVQPQGYEGTLIHKNDEYRFIWLNTDENVIYIVGTTGLSLDVASKIAENLF